MRVVTINDRMQQGYRYELVAPTGEKFDPEFTPGAEPGRDAKISACSAAST